MSTDISDGVLLGIDPSTLFDHHQEILDVLRTHVRDITLDRWFEAVSHKLATDPDTVRHQISSAGPGVSSVLTLIRDELARDRHYRRPMAPGLALARPTDPDGSPAGHLLGIPTGYHQFPCTRG